MRDALVTKDLTLKALEDEIAAQSDKIGILAKSLGRHRCEEFYFREKIEQLEIQLDARNAKLHSGMVDLNGVISELEKTKSLLSVSEEKHKNADEKLTQAIIQTTEQLSISHAQELEKLRNELESSYSEEIRRIHELADEKRQAEVRRVKNELMTMHATEIVNAVSDKDVQVRSEMSKNADEKLSQAIIQTTEQLSISHAQELEKLRNELESSYSEEIRRIHELADEKRQAEVRRVKNELMTMHATEIVNAVSDKDVQVRSEMNASASQRLTTQRNEMILVREKLEFLVSEKDSLVRELVQAKEARSISEEKLKKAEMQMAEILSKQMQTDSIEEEITEKRSCVELLNGMELVEMKLDEGLPNDTRHESAPQDEVYGAHSLAVDTSCGETPPSSEGTPTSARSSSSLVIPTFAKFDSLKQRYLKIVRESPKAAAGASLPKQLGGVPSV